MKIDYLILKNFSAIKNAMDANEIIIDFSSCVNKICLLIGPNGSGKTTLLSMMHPFADLGNLDVRNGNSLVLKDKEGYKEIKIINGCDEYVIKHFYSPHKDKSHSVKSYIEKNGVELNTNGNVTSFKEWVKEELQIEPDYLKLIRLGSNVTSLIDMTSTERKNFMSKILDDIGIFLEYYKSVNSKLRQLDDMISHTVDKLKRLGIDDRKDIEDKISLLNDEISKSQNEFADATSHLAIYRHNIKQIDDSENLRDNLRIVTKKYEKMTNILNKKDEIDSFELSYYVENISKIEKEILVNETELGSTDIIIKNSLNRLNTMQEKLHDLDIQITKETNTSKEIDRMNDQLNKMRLQLREYEDNIGDYSPSYTKQAVEDFIIFLKNTQQVLGRTYEFGKAPVNKVVKLLESKQNVMNYINRHLIDIDESKNDKSSLFLSTLMSRFMFSSDKEIVIDCKEECQAKTLFNQIQTLLENAEVTDKNETAEFYHDMEFVYQNIISVIPTFAEYKSLIEQLPENLKHDFELKTIYENISKLHIIYNEKSMNDLLSMITEYDNYIQLLSEYQREEETLQKFSNLSNIKYVTSQYEELEEQITSTRDEIFNMKERMISLKERNKELQNDLEVMKDIKETIERYDEIKELYEKYTTDYKVLQENSEKAKESELYIEKIRINIDNLNSQLQGYTSALDQYTILNKELKKYNKIYDDMTYVKTSLSSKEGMPLYFIQNYLGNTEEITNELLDIAYEGRIYIDKFDITATDFSIPFFNKGVRLSDVKYASQGELSFLTLALSFALSSQAISKYNIMLWDEIDGPLDEKNREKFIRIVENQINRVHSDQNFLITHNNMFSSYPVDIIDLSFSPDKEAYPLASYVNIERK